MSRKIGDRAFSVAAPRAWNRLVTDLKLLRSTASFKSKLKSCLFHAAYTGNTVWTLECANGLLVGAHYKSLLLLLLFTVSGAYVSTSQNSLFYIISTTVNAFERIF